MDEKKYFIKTLLQSGLLITKQRLLIFSFLYNQKKPVSIGEIYKKIDSKKINQVTIYRILSRFKEIGLVNQIDLHENKAYFELKDKKQDHHHIICMQCKKIKDFIGCDYKKLSNKILKETQDFAKITNHSFELFGICKSCS